MLEGSLFDTQPIQLEQQLQAALLQKERLLAEEKVRQLEEDLKNSLDLDVGFDPLTLEAELVSAQRLCPRKEKLPKAKKCHRTLQCQGSLSQESRNGSGPEDKEAALPVSVQGWRPSMQAKIIQAAETRNMLSNTTLVNDFRFLI